MIFSRLIKKAALAVGSACLGIAGFSGIALADYAATGAELEGWKAQIVVQNGQTADGKYDFKWMEGEQYGSLYYQAVQSATFITRPNAFKYTDDSLTIASIRFYYIGSCTGTCQMDMDIANIVLYSEGYDSVTVANFNSTAYGVNFPNEADDYSIFYDFKDQIDASIRTDFLKKLEKIECDIAVSYCNFSDAEQVEASGQIIDMRRPAAPVDESGKEMVLQEFALPGQSSGLMVQYFGMDNENWKWHDVTTDIDLIYGKSGHYSAKVDGASVFEAFYAGEEMNTTGFQFVQTTTGKQSDTYVMDYSIKNIVLKFDGYDDLSIPDFNNFASGNGSKYVTKYEILKYFPEGADVADMLMHMTGFEFDAEVNELGIYVPADSYVAPTEEETTEAPTEATTEAATEAVTEAPAKETTAKSEETTAIEETSKAKEEETVAADETTMSENSTEAASETEKSEEKSDKKEKSTVKTVVTIIAIVLLIAALVGVAVMYVKKSKM